MKFQSFDKVTCTILRDEINSALAAIGTKYGVKFSAGSARFSEKVTTFKLDIGIVDASGKAVSKDEETLRRYAGFLGLKPEHMTKEFSLCGKKYTLAGYTPRRYSKPFLLNEIGTGRRVVAPKNMVLNALGITPRGFADDLGSIR